MVLTQVFLSLTLAHWALAEQPITHQLPQRRSGYQPPPGPYQPYHGTPTPKPYAPSPYTPAPYAPTPKPYHPPKKYHPPTPTPVYHPKPTVDYVHEPEPLYKSTAKPHYSPKPTPTYHPSPAPYTPKPKAYHPTTTPAYHEPVTKAYREPKYVKPAHVPSKPVKPVYKPEPEPYHPVKPVHAPVKPGYEPEPHGPSHYAFGYAVKDSYSGDDFSHSETRDGYTTSGEYRVALPDGRIQIVTYHADENGYHADVRYEGEIVPYEPAPPKAHEPHHHLPDPVHAPLPKKLGPLAPAKPIYAAVPEPVYDPVTPKSHGLPPKKAHAGPYTPAPYLPHGPTYKPTTPYAPAYKPTPTPYPAVPLRPALAHTSLLGFNPKQAYHEDEPVYKPKVDPYKAKLAGKL